MVLIFFLYIHNMLWFQIFGFVASVSAGRESYTRIGYFWHITDIHYDGHINSQEQAKKGCWRTDYQGSSKKFSRRPMGRFGDYSCDSTWELIESAAKTMAATQSDNVEFVLWTGDGLSHTVRNHLSKSRQLELLGDLTDLLSKTFRSAFVFPALGHEDPDFLSHLVKMWSRWLPYDSMNTFETGGYYIIERKQLKLQIVVLNTNLMRRAEHDEEAAKQWTWLQSVLHKFQRNGETVYLVGHMAPGSNERQKPGVPTTTVLYEDYHNKKYLKIVRNYSKIIVGQFFGHLHSDTFRVIYEEDGAPVSWAMLAPSLTPNRNSDGPNNPGLRLYKFDKDSGQVFDYTQYYLDLSLVNSDENINPEWILEYNFSTYYSINEINSANLHNLADRLSQPGIFNRYYRANSVRINNNAAPGCDQSCALIHYCTITRIDFENFHKCLQSAASALSASKASSLFRPSAAISVVTLLTSALLLTIVRLC